MSTYGYGALAEVCAGLRGLEPLEQGRDWLERFMQCDVGWPDS
ncbi:hypothetical protein [Vitiosangium sp. GDMCC 1.1324]|nr:hypothetical protein [Vitiosangium sp. GDMCC 1.1324]